MEGYKIHIPKSVGKDILRISHPWVDRIMLAVDHLNNDPFYGEKMAGKLAECRKIRVWPYRIIYRVDKKAKTIVLVEVGHRGGMSYK